MLKVTKGDGFFKKLMVADSMIDGRIQVSRNTLSCDLVFPLLRA